MRAFCKLKAEQPAAAFKEFHQQVLNEAARCIEMPYNIAAANSSQYNYASGRLDHQMFFMSVSIAQTFVTERLIEPFFSDFWLPQYLALASGIAPSDLDLSEYKHLWGWDKPPHIDQLKEMQAITGYWDKGLLTDEEILLDWNVDPEMHYEQLERMVSMRSGLGLPLPGVVAQQVVTGDADADQD